MKRINVFLMVLVVAVLATSTIVSKINGGDEASASIYNSWWFILLLALVGVGAVAAIFREKLWQVPYRLLLYSSVVVILLGGGLTTWTGSHGSMTLQPGVPCCTFANEDGQKWALPFALTLDRFEVVTYPGSHAPMDFVSHITAGDEKAVISMNHIYKHGGYRFYQEDYDEKGNSTLSVAHDPIGIAVTYAGYLLLLVGLIAMFLSPKSHFKRLLKGLPVVALLMMGCVASAKPTTLPRHTADQLGRVQVLYKGRVCPLQTFAKDFTTKLYGKATYQGLSPEQVLSGWMFYNSEWCDEPMIKIKGAELRLQLGMEGRYTSFSNLQAHEGLLDSQPATKEFAAANEKKNLVQMVMNSKLLKIYPLADSTGTIGWYSQNDPLPIGVDDDAYLFVRKQLGYCQELVIRGDYATLDTVFAKTCKYQQKQASEVLPSPVRFRAERLYNALTTGRWLAMLSVMLGLLSFALTISTTGSKKDHSKLSVFNSRVAVATVALLTCFLLLIIGLRWVAGGHVPMAGGFDSMNLMSATLGVVALSMARRHRAAPSVALLAMGFCQLVAMMSGSNPPITHLMPVLNSPLLTLHVTVIMIAYALFLFVMLSSLAALFLPAQRVRLERSNLLMLYPAVALLSIGIVIGAVWANISWGNYWSWDPKEVWALITLIVYLYPLYLARKENHSRFGFHLYCVLAILSVAITYFGVNLILGGIHSYG